MERLLVKILIAIKANLTAQSFYLYGGTPVIRKIVQNKQLSETTTYV